MNYVKALIVKLVALILFVIVMVASSYNSDPVALVFLDWRTPEAAVSIWILAAFVSGIAVAMGYNLWANTQLRLAARKANKSVDKAHQEVDKIKAEAPAQKVPVANAALKKTSAVAAE
jgi:uncharacterized integral membrane protein